MKVTVTAPDAPAAIGPYSHAVMHNGLLLTSGQIGADPVTGQMAGPDAASQTRQCMRNLDAVLRAAGAGWNDVLKATVYLADMADFTAMNEEYKSWFTSGYPARCCVATAGMALGARVEIELLAAVSHCNS